MGFLVIDSNSITKQFKKIDDFCFGNIDSFKLILALFRQGYNLVSDLLLPDVEVINNVKFIDVGLKIVKINIDNECKRAILSALSKIVYDASAIPKCPDGVFKYPEGNVLSEFSGVPLGIVNKLGIFSFLGKPEYRRYKIQVYANGIKEEIYNVFDLLSFNTVGVLQNALNLHNYFNNIDFTKVTSNSDFSNFEDFQPQIKKIILDRLYNDLPKLLKPHEDLTFDRLDSLNGLIEGGMEYRLNKLPSHTAYRLYYFIRDGSICLVCDSNKTDNKITKSITNRIQSIYKGF